MPAAARALLFALCALAAPAHLQAVEPCSMATAPATATNKFIITVEPLHYQENTNYTVTVKGASTTDTFTELQLQALDRTKNTNSGEWKMETGTHLCPDKNLLYNTSSNSFTAHWTSPNTAGESVEIKAYFKEAADVKFVGYNLTTASSTPSEPPKGTGTTKQPVTDVTHATNTTHATEKPPIKTDVTATTKPTHSTTAGSESGAYSSCILIAMVQSVYLLFIGGRQ